MPYAAVRIINTLLNVYNILLMARILLSWFPVRSGGVLADIFEVLYALTEPLLAPIRKLIPPIAVGMGYLDLSPMILIMLLSLIRGMLF